MELYKTTFQGREVSVIFCGSMYLFYNSFFGYLAAAKREQRKEFNPGNRTEAFTVQYGNSHAIGSSLTNSRILSGVHRFIKRLEIEHNASAVYFTDNEADLNGAYLDLESAFKVR